MQGQRRRDDRDARQSDDRDWRRDNLDRKRDDRAGQDDCRDWQRRSRGDSDWKRNDRAGHADDRDWKHRSRGGKGGGGKGRKGSKPPVVLGRRSEEACLQVACTVRPAQINGIMSVADRLELGLPAEGDVVKAFVDAAADRGVKFTYRMRNGREYASAYLSDDAGDKRLLHQVMSDWLTLVAACGEDLNALTLPAYYGIHGQGGSPPNGEAIPWFERIVKGRLQRRDQAAASAEPHTGAEEQPAASDSLVKRQMRLWKRGFHLKISTAGEGQMEQRVPRVAGGHGEREPKGRGWEPPQLPAIPAHPPRSPDLAWEGPCDIVWFLAACSLHSCSARAWDSSPGAA